MADNEKPAAKFWCRASKIVFVVQTHVAAHLAESDNCPVCVRASFGTTHTHTHTTTWER